MKKRLTKLLLSAVLLVVGVVQANAQAFYNQKYTEGVTVAQGGDYFLYNIGSGTFLTNGMNWGTHATGDHAGRIVEFASSGAGFTVKTNNYSLNNGRDGKVGFLTSNAYVDTGSGDAWTFTPVTIDGYENAYTLKLSETQYLLYNASNSYVDVGASTNDKYSYWLIIPRTAREEAGDYTYLLLNTDFNCPWELKAWSGNNANNNNIFANGGLEYNRCGERYHSKLDLYQDIAATVPNGTYVVSAQGFYRKDGGSEPTYLYANSEEVELQLYNGDKTDPSMNGASLSFIGGLYVNAVEVTVLDNNLKVGIKTEGTSNWVIFDNFHISKALDYYKAEYAALVKQANKLLSSEQIEEEKESALNMAIVSAANLTTTEQYKGAIQNLTAAVEEAKAATTTSKFLKNADFSNSVPTISNVFGYGHDGKPFSLQGVKEWTIKELQSTTDNNGDPHAGLGGAVFAYGSQQQLRGNQKIAPSADPDGDVIGNALGYFAVWGNGGYYYQDVTLPAGKYTLTIPTYCQSGTQANTSYIGFLADNGTQYVAKTNPQVGTWENLTTEFTIYSKQKGKIALGYVSTGSGSGANPHLFFDRVSIQSTTDVNVTADDVAAVIETIPEGAMNSDIESAMSLAKTAAEENPSWETITALASAIDAAKASIAAYENAAQWLPVNKAELESTNFVDPAVYEAKITDAETALADGTMTDEWANSITNIKEIGHKAANYIDDILLTPWTIDGEQAKDYDQSLYINTWSTEFDEEDPNFKVPYFEYWTSGNSLPAKDITGTIEGLEPGDYAVTALVRVETKSSDAPYGIKMFVNGDTQPIEGTRIGNTSRYLQNASAFGTVGQDGKLTVTFSVNEDNNISWLAFKNVNYVKGAASIADFKATEEPTLLNLNGTEAFLVDDEGITYIQDANANVGLAIKGYDIDFTEEKQILSGQLFGTASGDTIIVDAENNANEVIVSEGKATPKTLTPAEAALAESTFLLANIEQVEITEEEEVKYAEAEDGKVEIDNRLCEDLVVNTGDVLNTLAGITFLNEEGTNSVIAPRVQDDVVPVLWKAPSGITVGDAVTESEPIDLTTEDVQARMANLKAGDALNIAIETTAPANIIVKNENGDIYTIPVMAEETNVEVPVTAFMEKDIQNHGVKIFADSEDLKAKYVTVRNAKYPDTENSIWLGEGNDVTLGKQHFGDVREGDMLEAEGEEETVMAIGEEEIENGELTEDQAASVQEQGLTVTGATKVTFTLGDDMRLDITDNEEGESFNQGDKDLSVEGMIMTYGGNDPEGAVYEYAEAYPAANNFKTVTDGIDQFPVDNEDKAYNKDDKNLPTKGTFYVFEPTKDGQIEATVGVEGGKTIIVTEEGEAIVEEKKDADFEGPITFPVEATKTYYLFANDTNLKLFGFKFTQNDPNAENTVKDIETFKLLSANSIDGDTLLLKDAVVNYIHGDDVFVEDASGAIDFYRTQIQYYVGQVLNGYIIGSNDIVENMPVLLRTDGTKYGQFKVTDKVTPKATPATVADVTKDENLARFMKLEYVEVQRNERGFKMLVDPETQESVLVEDHFGVFYELGDLMESIEGIVGKNSEGEFAFWPTSKEGTVISDGFKQMVETELYVTNKDVAKDKNNPVVGISVTLDGAFNAGSGSSMAGAMTSKGYKLSTANGSPDKNSAKFTVNDNQKVFDMTINAVANYAAKDTEKPCITVTKVEVDGKEVSFEGGEFPAKGASDCGSLILKGINAEKDIVIYFDNSNAEGTQLNMAYAITCRGEKVYTQKEKDLMAEAKKLAEDREAVAVGCLDDAIEAAEAGNTNGLQAAVDQFKADNADLEKDETDKVGTAKESWTVNPAVNNRGTYTKNGITLVEHYGDSKKAVMISQEVSVDNGNYNIEVYASSYNERGEDGASLQETSGDVAYVFGESGDNIVKTWIVARKGTGSGLLDDDPKSYAINGVQVVDGKLTIGLATDKEKQTGWHTIQIKSLKWATTAKAAYASEKAKLVALLEEAEGLLAGDQIGGRAKFEAAVAEANEAKESIRLNIEGMTEEVAKLQEAIEKFHAAGKVFVLNVATGKYLAAGANWGTHAVLNNTGLDYDIKKLEDGTMTFDSQVSNGGSKNYLNGEWNDGEAFGWTVEQLSNGNYTIFNGEKYLCAGDDGLVVLGDNADEWSFVSVADRKESLAAATSEAPVDATFLIKGANFGRNDKRNNSWEVSSDCTNKNLSGGEKSDGSMGNNCAESYHSTFTISQVVADAPAGTYVLTAQGFYRQDDNATEDAPVYFANDEKQAIVEKTGSENSMTDAGISFKDGLYPLQSITVVVEEDGTLTIGVQGTGTHQWVIWDNFQLMYYGVGGEPTTKINEVKEVAEPAAVHNSFEDGAIYNLRGQKMEGTLKPGLYIKNGRKFVVK